MTDLLTRAQITVLAQTLHADPDDVAGLARLGAEGVRDLTAQLSAALFDADEPTFARLAKLAPLVPDALVTKVAVSAVPPEVAGRAGGSLGVAHPGRAAAILAAMPADYLADAAAHLDPRAVAALAPLLSGEYLVPAANELLQRGDHLTAARFVEHATESLIDDFERGITDNDGLLRTAAVVPVADRLRRVVDRLPVARREAIILSARNSEDSLVAALSVLSRLDPGEGARLFALLVDTLDDDGADRLVSTAVSHGAVGELLGIAAESATAVADRLCAAAARLAPDTIADADAGRLIDGLTAARGVTEGA
ncbi:hypothetical protein ACWEVD_28610 [Nocardia thailandica]